MSRAKTPQRSSKPSPRRGSAPGAAAQKGDLVRRRGSIAKSSASPSRWRRSPLRSSPAFARPDSSASTIPVTSRLILTLRPVSPPLRSRGPGAPRVRGELASPDLAVAHARRGAVRAVGRLTSPHQRRAARDKRSAAVSGSSIPRRRRSDAGVRRGTVRRASDARGVGRVDRRAQGRLSARCFWFVTLLCYAAGPGSQASRAS